MGSDLDGDGQFVEGVEMGRTCKVDYSVHSTRIVDRIPGKGDMVADLKDLLQSHYGINLQKLFTLISPSSNFQQYQISL